MKVNNNRRFFIFGHLLLVSFNPTSFNCTEPRILFTHPPTQVFQAIAPSVATKSV
jgi:hypothetical protein